MLLVSYIKEAREFLATHNWIQNHTSDGVGGYCAYGAICTSLRNIQDDHHATENKVLDALERCLPLGTTGIIAYNDTYGRTKEQILEIFDCAIENLEKNG